MKQIITFLSMLCSFSFYGQTVKASDQQFGGYNANDASVAFAAAINSQNDTIIVDYPLGSNGVWNVGPNWFRHRPVDNEYLSNKTIIFEPGVEVKAIDSKFTANLDMLLRFENLDSLNIVAYGAKFSMDRSQYSTGESRHNVAFYDCDSISWEGGIIEGSGGDGILISTRHQDQFSSNISIKNVEVKGHRRQGISVISVDGLLVENCKFNDTFGTAPMAGLDLEPNFSTQVLKNVSFENCEFANNGYSGILMAVTKQNETSDDISIDFKDNYIHNNWQAPPVASDTTSIFVSYPTFEVVMGTSGSTNVSTNGGLKGTVSFDNTLIKNGKYRAFFTRKYNDMYRLTFDNLIVEDMGQSFNASYNEDRESSPFQISRFGYNTALPSQGNMAFENMLIKESRDVPFLYLWGPSGDNYTIENFTIANTVVLTPDLIGISDARKVLCLDPSVDNCSPTPVTTSVNFSLDTSLSNTTVSLSSNQTWAVRGEQEGEVVLTRSSSDISYPLAVEYTIGGNQNNGDDFDMRHGYVIIPANQTSTTITVRARAKTALDGQVIFTLVDTANYDISGEIITIEILKEIPSFLTVNDQNVIISPYAPGTQDDGTSEIIENNTLKLEGNAWKRGSFNYTVTENTVVTFDFRATGLGEIHAFALETDGVPGAGDLNRLFQLGGTDTYGANQQFNTYSGSDWVSFSIPVGEFYIGDINYLIFLADKDTNPSIQESFFRNITFREQTIDLQVDGIDRNMSAYADDQGFYEILEEGSTLRLFDNSWKRAIVNKTITPNTILEFEFKINGPGEIHSIGFDNDDIYNNIDQVHFQLAGTQSPVWATREYQDYTTADMSVNDGWKSYSIPVGQFITGDFMYLAFIGDKDIGDTTTQESFFRNITFREQTIDLQVDGIDRNVSAYADDQGFYEILEEGSTLRLFDNSWKRAIVNKAITPNTILEFEFKINGPGEIHSIGFDNDDIYNNIDQVHFQLAGTQSPAWATREYRDYTTADMSVNDGWKSYSIPVGQFITGDFMYLAFIGDKDIGDTTTQESFFRNIGFKEEVPIEQTVSLSPVQDAYLQGSTRYNTDVIRVESGNRTGYLMYDLSGINGAITNAELEFTVASDPGDGTITINKGSGTTWTETNLSTSNSPNIGTLLGSINETYVVGNVKIIPLNISELNGGLLSLVLMHSSGNDTDFASKEHATLAAAQLKITYTPSTSLQSKLFNTASVSNEMVVFPNPTLNNINIAGMEGKKQILLIDMTGRVVYKTTSSELEVKMDMSTYPKGMYIVQVKGAIKTEAFRVVKQ